MSLAHSARFDEAPDAPLPGMIGECPAMWAVYRLIRRVAPTDLPVLIEGETGTGKELVARALHELGPRAAGPLVDLNCAAITEGLAEAELFGWERGAFSGAHQQVCGLLELADGGTLFLDEVCSLPTAVQAKALRAVERHEFRRVGGRTIIPSDFRLVAAVSRPVEDLLATGALRPDFAFRLAGITVTLPPLRARDGDIRLLAEHFLEAAGRAVGRPMRWHDDALAALEGHAWPGNVRELEMLVRRLHLLAEHDVIGIDDLNLLRCAATCRRSPEREAQGLEPQPQRELPARAKLGRKVPPTATEIAEALSAANGVVSRAAEALGLGRPNLYRLMKECGIPPGSSPSSIDLGR